MLPHKFDLRFALQRIPPITATYLAAAFVFGNTVLPLAGGPIKPYELREFRAAMTAFMNGDASAPQIEPVVYPHRIRLLPESMPQAEARLQYASLPAREEEQPELELAALETMPALDGGDVTPAMQTFDEEQAICIGECGGDEEPLEALPEEELETVEPKLVALTPS
jgi:hypothetical protein